jgi:hypothetical protein
MSGGGSSGVSEMIWVFTLSVHTRQDAAYTLLNTISLVHGTDLLVRLTEKHIRVLQVWMCALTLGMIFLIWKAL